MWMGKSSTKTMGHGPHSHPVPEVLVAIGSDPEHPEDLGAEFEMFMGEEMEKHIITKSTMIYVPENTVHCPFTIKKVTRPFLFMQAHYGPKLAETARRDPGARGYEKQVYLYRYGRVIGKSNPVPTGLKVKTENMELQSHRSYITPGIIAILLWCMSGVCFRRGSEVMGSSMVYLTFMTGCGSLTAVVLQYLRGQSLINMVHLPFKVIIAGFFGVALYTVMLAKAFGIAAEQDIGQINLLNYLWPVWMAVLGMLLLKSRPGAVLAITGILMGFFGVVISRGL